MKKGECSDRGYSICKGPEMRKALKELGRGSGGQHDWMTLTKRENRMR